MEPEQSTLVVEFVDGAEWVLTEEFPFRFFKNNQVHRGTVPAGFITDGASVPRAFWWFIPRWGKYGEAAVVHDFLYTAKEVVTDGESTPVTREEVDDLFYESMRDSGVGRIRANIMYIAVRLFGGSAWKNA